MKNEKNPPSKPRSTRSDAEFLSQTVKELYLSLAQLGSLVLQLQLSQTAAPQQAALPPPPIQVKASSTLH